MGQGKLGRGIQQHKKATQHTSPCQNEQKKVVGWNFRIYMTRVRANTQLAYSYECIFFSSVFSLDEVDYTSPVWGSPKHVLYEICFFVCRFFLLKYQVLEEIILFAAACSFLLLNFRYFSRFFLLQSVCTRAAWWLHCLNEAAYCLKWSGWTHNVVLKQAPDDRTLSWQRANTQSTPTTKTVLIVRIYSCCVTLSSTPKYYQGCIRVPFFVRRWIWTYFYLHVWELFLSLGWRIGADTDWVCWTM